MQAPLPLARFTVLDLSSHRSGPTAIRQFADWGADVIKIEARDAAGRDVVGSDRLSPDSQNLHRNKRAMTLNLKTPEGRGIFFRLVEQADVIVENFRPQVKHRLGIDYDTVVKVNPRIVYGSISGFGEDGPYADRPGVDQIAQGMAGLMSITGIPGQGPVRVGIPIADLTAGLFLAQAILIGLLQREVTGEGQWVRTSLLESQIFMLDFQAARWLVSGEVPVQAGNDHPTGIPTGVFPTADGAINLSALGDKMWCILCDEIDRADLAQDPRFATAQKRSTNRVELNALIAERTVQCDRAYWVAKLNDAGIPCGPINSIDQVFDDEQVKHLGVARPMDHPALGAVALVGQPFKMSAASERIMTPAPEPSQHTDEILADLGFMSAEIQAFRERNII